MTAMIQGRDSRVALCRAKLRYWKSELSLAARDAAESYARVCQANIDYFRQALREEI